MARKPPLYPHIPKSRKPQARSGFPFYPPSEREQLIQGLLEVSEQLAYAYLNATRGYRKEALTHIQIAETKLGNLGVDTENLEPVLQPLGVISPSMDPRQMAAYINDAQEELKRFGPGWTR